MPDAGGNLKSKAQSALAPYLSHSEWVHTGHVPPDVPHLLKQGWTLIALPLFASRQTCPLSARARRDFAVHVPAGSKN